MNWTRPCSTCNTSNKPLRLPDDQRITLELAYGAGHTCEEIAVIMGCAVGTVKARMFHARVRLRSVMPALGSSADDEVHSR